MERGQNWLGAQSDWMLRRALTPTLSHPMGEGEESEKPACTASPLPPLHGMERGDRNRITGYARPHPWPLLHRWRGEPNKRHKNSCFLGVVSAPEENGT